MPGGRGGARKSTARASSCSSSRCSSGGGAPPWRVRTLLTVPERERMPARRCETHSARSAVCFWAACFWTEAVAALGEGSASRPAKSSMLASGIADFVGEHGGDLGEGDGGACGLALGLDAAAGGDVAQDDDGVCAVMREGGGTLKGAAADGEPAGCGCFGGRSAGGARGGRVEGQFLLGRVLGEVAVAEREIDAARGLHGGERVELRRRQGEQAGGLGVGEADLAIAGRRRGRRMAWSRGSARATGASRGSQRGWPRGRDCDRRAHG